MSNISKDLIEDTKTGLSKNIFSASFLLYVSATSVLAGFGLALAKARKSNPSSFGSTNNDGAKLALKALGYGSIISVSACGLLVVFVAKVFGVNSVSVILLK